MACIDVLRRWIGDVGRLFVLPRYYTDVVKGLLACCVMNGLLACCVMDGLLACCIVVLCFCYAVCRGQLYSRGCLQPWWILQWQPTAPYGHMQLSLWSREILVFTFAYFDAKSESLGIWICSQDPKGNCQYVLGWGPSLERRILTSCTWRGMSCVRPFVRPSPSA